MTDIGGNITELKKKIALAIKQVRDLKEERHATNEQIGAVRADMAALGIPKAAFDMAMTYLNWESEKREGFDLAYALVREAGGLPMQEDLFTAAEQKYSKVEAKKSEPNAAVIDEEIKAQEAAKKKNKAKSGADEFFDPSKVTTAGGKSFT